MSQRSAGKSDLSGAQTALTDLEKLVLADPHAAVKETQQLLEQARGQGNALLEGQLLCIQAAAHYFLAQLDEALDTYQQVLDLVEQEAQGLVVLKVRTLNGLGNVHCLRGEYVRGMDFYYTSARLAQETGDEVGWQRASSNIGLMYARFGDHEEALKIHEGLVEAASRLNSHIQVANARVNVMEDYLLLGDHVRVVHLAESYLAQDEPYPQYEGVVRTLLAHSLLHLNQLEEALAQAQQAREVLDALAYRDYLCRLLEVLGRIYQRQGRHEQALETLLEGLQLTQKHKITLVGSDIHEALAALYESQGEYRLALQHLRAHHELTTQTMQQNVLRRVQLAQLQYQLEMVERNLQQVQHDAQHDPLTGLLNRVHFRQRAQAWLDRHPQRLMGVAFLDLDEFKSVNDSLGHDQGDELLAQLAARLRDALRQGDLLGRMGGDEFSVLFSELQDEQELLRAASRLLAEITRPFELAGQMVTLMASVGLALHPRHASDIVVLQRLADLAMYQVKHTGQGGLHLYQQGDRIDPNPTAPRMRR